MWACCRPPVLFVLPRAAPRRAQRARYPAQPQWPPVRSRSLANACSRQRSALATLSPSTPSSTLLAPPGPRCVVHAWQDEELSEPHRVHPRDHGEARVDQPGMECQGPPCPPHDRAGREARRHQQGHRDHRVVLRQHGHCNCHGQRHEGLPLQACGRRQDAPGQARPPPHLRRRCAGAMDSHGSGGCRSAGGWLEVRPWRRG